MTFYPFHFDQMTLIPKPYLDIVKTYLYTLFEIKFLASAVQKLQPKQNSHKHRQTEAHTDTDPREVIYANGNKVLMVNWSS